MLRHLPGDSRETEPRSSAERWQRFGAVAAVVSAAGFLLWRCVFAPDVAFLTGSGWITDPRAVDARIQGYGDEQVPVARFTRRFDLVAAPAAATLRIEAARAHRVFVNGAPIASAPDPDPAWRRGHRVEIAAALRAGANEIAVDVWNPRGPPLLRARVEGIAASLATDPSWQVAVDGGAPAPAVRPDDTRLHPSHAAGPHALRALRERWVAVAAALAFAAVALRLGAGWLVRHRAHLPWLALALVHVLWIALFTAKLVSLPLTTGFDARHHLAYVDWLLRERALPLPSDGWSTYHPPLYYVLAALAQQTLGPIGTKLPSFAAGLGLVWATFALARTLLPTRPEAIAAAVLFAGVLPLDVYTAAYVSNEPLHAALFGVGVWLCARALAAPRVTLAGAALTGAAVGLALLAKVTALVLAAVAGCFLLARVVQHEGFAIGRLAGVAAAYAVPIAAIAGWFYARNLALYGMPVVGNWNLPGMGWWSQPGFHTPAYYLGFGESLRRPVLAGFHSFADAMYASFWGDGWIAGRASAAFPTEIWSWDFAVIGYWAALPATGAIAFGLARMAQLAFAHAECGRRAAWSFLLATLGALATALIALTLDLPYFGQAKAPYVLGLVPVLAVAFALAAERADRALAARFGARAASAARAGWLGIGILLWLSLAA